jgi:hypothetical protein
MEKTFREMIGLETKSNYNIEDILNDIKSDEKGFNIKPSEVKWGGKTSLGNYDVVMYRQYVLVYDKEKVHAILSVYEINSFETIPEKELLVVYGHETIVLYFLDGTLKEIATR